MSCFRGNCLLTIVPLSKLNLSGYNSSHLCNKGGFYCHHKGHFRVAFLMALTTGKELWRQSNMSLTLMGDLFITFTGVMNTPVDLLPVD